MSTALAKSGGGFIVQPQNIGELKELCNILADSEIVPKDYKGKAGNCFVAIQFGAELGLSPLQALQNIAVINGRGAIWGDAQLALCMAHPDYVDTIETFDVATMTATCVAKRRGRADRVESFSMEDAKLAKLTDKSNTPWQTYPKRMLKMRARGFALRDQWTDVLKGLHSVEEVGDYPKEVRAEVVSSTPMADQGGATSPAEVVKQINKAEPKPSTPVGPVFWPGWPDKTWAGRLLTDAPSSVLCEYLPFMESLSQDQKRPRLKASALKSMEAVQAILDARMEAEAEKAQQVAEAEKAADPIAAGMQAAHDNTHAPTNNDTNGAWGLESPQ